MRRKLRISWLSYFWEILNEFFSISDLFFQLRCNSKQQLTVKSDFRALGSIRKCLTMRLIWVLKNRKKSRKALQANIFKITYFISEKVHFCLISFHLLRYGPMAVNYLRLIELLIHQTNKRAENNCSARARAKKNSNLRQIFVEFG